MAERRGEPDPSLRSAAASAGVGRSKAAKAASATTTRPSRRHAAAFAAGTFKLDVTVTSEAGAGFSAPFFTFTNLSTDGRQVSGVGVSDGPPWDWNANIPGTDYVITNPAGGTRTLLEGEEADH